MKLLHAMLTGALALLCLGGPAASDEVNPSATSTMTLHLQGPVDAAFAMFDPVHESLWSPHWRPRFLGTRTVAEGLVFVTTGHTSAQTVWLLDRYDAAARRLRYINVSGARTLTQLDISVAPRGAAASDATLRLVETALDPAALPDVRSSVHGFPAEAPHWEAAIDSVLRTRS